jgi:DNA primase
VKVDAKGDAISRSPLCGRGEKLMDFRDETEAIREASPIDEVLDERGVDVRQSGGGFICICPLPGHVDTHPSFSVSDDGRLFFCFGCQRGGDVFTLVQLLDECDFASARKKLASRAGIKIQQRRRT